MTIVEEDAKYVSIRCANITDTRNAASLEIRYMSQQVCVTVLSGRFSAELVLWVDVFMGEFKFDIPLDSRLFV